MKKDAIAFHIIYWTLAYILWLILTKNHHPDWIVRISCTLVLILSTALFASVAARVKIQWRSLLRFIPVLCAFGIGAAIVIHVLYDIMVGPNPRRFSFWSNVIMDTGFILINTVFAALCAFVVRQVTGRSVWILRAEKSAA